MTDVEDITAKTGNFKKFDTFVHMLRSALLSSSESVFIDLLTYSDLEALKSLRNSSQQHQQKMVQDTNGSTSSFTSTGPSSSSSSLAAGMNKRYLILTYTGEFDRVHYPIPLNFETEPDMMTLQRTCLRLRDELKALRSFKGQNTTNSQRTHLHLRAASVGRENELANEVRRLKEENVSLKANVRKLENDFDESDKDKLQTLLQDNEALQRQIKATLKERDFLKDKMNDLSEELVRSIYFIIYHYLRST